ncbi:hypothetical protein Hanom_Chr17g01530211 [Helianthus anomalus]
MHSLNQTNLQKDDQIISPCRNPLNSYLWNMIFFNSGVDKNHKDESFSIEIAVVLYWVTYLLNTPWSVSLHDPRFRRSKRVILLGFCTFVCVWIHRFSLI